MGAGHPGTTRARLGRLGTAGSLCALFALALWLLATQRAPRLDALFLADADATAALPAGVVGAVELLRPAGRPPAFGAVRGAQPVEIAVNSTALKRVLLEPLRKPDPDAGDLALACHVSECPLFGLCGLDGIEAGAARACSYAAFTETASTPRQLPLNSPPGASPDIGNPFEPFQGWLPPPLHTSPTLPPGRPPDVQSESALGARLSPCRPALCACAVGHEQRSWWCWSACL
eukprot:SM000227S07443  [mRNA]  locus=s227:68555:69423:- [translate_table: standard]